MNNVSKLQSAMLEYEQVDIKTRHQFTDGCYAREITIPAGVLLVGAKHLTEHFFVISKGKIMINNGVVLEAPYTGITLPGTKRAIEALEETVMTTFHVTRETNIEEIEKAIIDPEGLKIANNPKEALL